MVSANSVVSGNLNFYSTVGQQPANILNGSTTTIQVSYSNVVANTTKLLDQSALQSLSISPDGSTLTFSASSTVAQNLSIGDIIDVPPISQAPNGLLREVTSISQSATTITAVTSQATLSQAFQQASLQLSQTLTLQNVRSIVPKLAGLRVVVSPHPNRTSKTKRPDQLTDPCADNPTTIVESGSLNAPAGFTDTGTLEICANFQVSVQLAWASLRVQSADISASLDGQANFAVDGEFNQGLFSGQKQLAQIFFEPIIGEIGPFPVVVVPEMTFTLNANGKINASLSTAVALNASVTGGFQYANGSVSPISNVNLSFENDPVSVDASLTTKLDLEDEVDLLFYGVAGPYFSPDAYLEFSADITQDPWWTLTAGLEGPVGLKADVFGFLNMGDFEFANVLDKSAVLLHAPGPFAILSVTPNLTSATPLQAQAGASALTLTLSGSNFLPTDVVSFGTLPLATTFVSSQNLTAVVPSAALTSAGTFILTVSDANVAGAISSDAIAFVVVGNTSNPIPSIVSLSPASLPSGSAPQSLTLVGTGFISQSSATLNGLSHTPTIVSSTELTINLSSSDLATPGSYPVAVTNPTPGGGPSNVVAFTVSESTSGTVEISPASVTVPVGGAQTFTVSVVGSSDGVAWSIEEGADGGTIVNPTPSSAIYVPSSSTGTFHVVATNADNSSQSAVATISVVSALGLSILHTFDPSQGDGSTPAGSLLQATDGSFYGVTSGGGSSDSGTVFKINPSGNYTLLASFTGSGPGGPDAGLIQGSDGNFYGTSFYGGTGGVGTVYKMDPSGNLTVLHSFTDSDLGANPYAGVVEATDGNFYDTTYYGGDTNSGTAFKSDTSGNVTFLHSFSNVEGGSLYGGLIQARDNNFYGSAYYGGVSDGLGNGSVYKMDASGTVTVIHSFSGTDGSQPFAGLMQGSDGYLYGTTPGGGAYGFGEVFKISTEGNLTVLHSFIGQDGVASQASVIQGSDGDFYGTTSSGGAFGQGTIFRMDPNGNVTVLHSFSNADAGYVTTGVTQGTDGNLYGTGRGGSKGSGVIYELRLANTANTSQLRSKNQAAR